jgi:hypothetical protein
MKIIFRLSFLLPLIFCSGCIIPYHFTERPGVKGLVVDTQTGVPLANVNIALSAVYGTWNPTNSISSWHTNELASAYSKNNGTFEIRPIKQWGVLIIPGDYFRRNYELKTETTNYRATRIRFSCNGLDGGPNSEIIRLSREP